MGKACCVWECPSGANIPSHVFPKNPSQFQIWKQAVESPKIAHLTDEQLRKAVVCYRHFQDNDYCVGHEKRSLKRGVVPNLYLPKRELEGTSFSNELSKTKITKQANKTIALEEMQGQRKMEICVDSLESARNAINGGADRLELCSALSEGGLTPTPGFFKMIKSVTPKTVPIFAMIRIKSSDFHYDDEELNAMLDDLKILKSLGADGFVFGALKSDMNVDESACKKILEKSHPLPVTFHRAFDEVADPLEGLTLLKRLGFQRILTSGQKTSAEDGLELIKKLVQEAGNDIIIMPGAGINATNICKIESESGAREFHASAKTKKVCGSTESIVTDESLVRQLCDVVKSAS